MQFNSLQAFLDMGGYAFYVWLSYGVTAFLLVMLIWLSKSQHKSVVNKIITRQKRENKLRQAAAMQKQQQASAQSISPTNNDNDSNEVLS